MRFSKLTAVVLFSFAIIGYMACKKTDTSQATKPQTPNKFFTISATAPKEIKAIAEKLRHKNEQTSFINDFIKKQGYALWDKAQFRKIKNASIKNRGNQSRTLGSDSVSDYILIPLVLENQNKVHGALACLISGDSVYVNVLDGSRVK